MKVDCAWEKADALWRHQKCITLLSQLVPSVAWTTLVRTRNIKQWNQKYDTVEGSTSW